MDSKTKDPIPIDVALETDASKLQQERYRVFIEYVADGFYETSLQGNFLFFNDALCRIFGYERSEIEGRNYREFMDDKNAKLAFDAFNNIFTSGKGVTNIIWEITRKDGQRRILEISANLIIDDKKTKSGFRGVARDITQSKLAERTSNALFRISKALPRYRALDPLLEFIVKEIKDLLAVKGAMVILLDEKNREFFFRVAEFDDKETGKKFKEVRFPVDKGVAGHVYRTGESIMVPDTAKSPYFYQQVDEQAKYETKNMLDVPMRIQDRFIGVLCAVNKEGSEFDKSDVSVLSTIASMVALPIENARINDALNHSYEEVKSLNRAKDRVIHHLSHELKTPVAVLSASLGLLQKKQFTSLKKDAQKILDRAQRNLQRILEMQYQIEDILREKDFTGYQLLKNLLEACTDELEMLAMDEFGSTEAVEKIRCRVEDIFGPKNLQPIKIPLDRFVKKQIESLQPRFSHRDCELIIITQRTADIFIPEDVLAKIVEGFLRNAIENTPDKGRIEVIVQNGAEGPEFSVKDFGVGITKENQRLIFENNFTTYDTMQYASKEPFDFNAGGKGFDLLRMKIFSERYRFKLRMVSNRCCFIPTDTDLCPGNIDGCEHCRSVKDCIESGGTEMVVAFTPASKLKDTHEG